jgi:hypothetical protein
MKKARARSCHRPSFKFRLQQTTEVADEVVIAERVRPFEKSHPMTRSSTNETMSLPSLGVISDSRRIEVERDDPRRDDVPDRATTSETALDDHLELADETRAHAIETVNAVGLPALWITRPCRCRINIIYDRATRRAICRRLSGLSSEPRRM